MTKPECVYVCPKCGHKEKGKLVSEEDMETIMQIVQECNKAFFSLLKMRKD